MHNHFIIKSLDLTRPGGIVAVLTSRYTLDARNPAARREMNARADLLGAVRLPTGAHRRAAGTDAITDLLMFRRREPGRAPPPPPGKAPAPSSSTARPSGSTTTSITPPSTSWDTCRSATARITRRHCSSGATCRTPRRGWPVR